MVSTENTMACPACRWWGNRNGRFACEQPSGAKVLVITSPADGGLAKIHHRQPLVVPVGSESVWLGGSTAAAAGLMVASSADRFNWYRVSPDVGKVTLDHAGLLTPMDVDHAPLPSDQGDLFV